MNRIECRQEIRALMLAQIADIEIASSCLNLIKEAITGNQLELLNQLLENPELPLESIEQREQQRQQLALRSGFTTDFDGFKQCIEWCDDEQKSISGVYQDLIAGLQTLQHSLQLNNLLVNKGRDHLRRSLGILAGIDIQDQCKTYSNQGKTQAANNLRNIAIA